MAEPVAEPVTDPASVTVDRALVDRVALLARLRLTDDESTAMTAHLARMLELVDHLAEVDDPAASPYTGPAGATRPLREDEPRPSLPVAEALRNAPGLAGAPEDEGAFRVPAVLE